MISGHLIIASVAVILSSVVCKDPVLYELPVTNENGSMGLHTDVLCRSAGFVPVTARYEGSVPKSNKENDKINIAGAPQLSASAIVLVVLGVTVLIISIVFLGNFLYHKAKAHEYSL